MWGVKMEGIEYRIILTAPALAAAVAQQGYVNGILADDLLQYLGKEEVSLEGTGIFKLPTFAAVVAELRAQGQEMALAADTYMTREARLLAHEKAVLERLTGEEENVGDEEVI